MCYCFDSCLRNIFVGYQFFTSIADSAEGCKLQP
jgi:hypothetical protein